MRMKYRRLTLVLAVALECLAIGCSSKSSKAPGPAAAPETGEPCSTACCCLTEDGYYRRHTCTSAAECSESGGRCLEADTPRCRH
jgi:hypothetical protein